MKKRIITLILTLVFTFGLMTVASAANPVKLQFNGKNLTSEVPPVIQSGKTLVPVRVISETLGADVNWDPQTRTVTIVKNNDTIILVIDSKDVKKNGIALNKQEVPARIMNGKTMVPVRFVSEALGAQIGWDGATKTVKINFLEKKNGMTAGELLEKSTVAMAAYDTYKFTANGDMKLVVPKTPAMNMNLTMEGAFRKPAEMYFKETVEAKIPNAPQQKTTVEMYTYDGKFYQKIDDSEWQPLDITLPADMMAQLQNQDPAAAIEQMKKFGLIVTYGNEVKIDGKDYYALYVRIDEANFKKYLQESLAQLETPGELFNGMKFELSYRGYVNKDTLILEKINYDGVLSMTAEGETLKMFIDLDMAMFDFNAPVTMPDVTK